MDWLDLMLGIKTASVKLNSKWFPWALLLAASVRIFFLPVLQGEFLNWEDRTLFVENPYYRGVSPSHWRWMCTTVLRPLAAVELAELRTGLQDVGHESAGLACG
ncbi:MAG: hypothetical protein WCH86_07140 [Kiritimatiellales bacterium]